MFGLFVWLEEMEWGVWRERKQVGDVNRGGRREMWCVCAAVKADEGAREEKGGKQI